MEIPNAPSPAKPTQGVSGLPILAPMIDGKAVAAGPEQAGRQIFPALFEGRIGIADGAVVADVAGDDRVFRQAGLDRAPGLPRRHAVGVALARVRIPCGARIVVLMIHAGKRLQPPGLGRMDQRLALLAAGIARRRRKLRQNALRDELGVAADADGDRLGQADAVGIDIDLDDLGGLRPVVDAVARQRRERIEPGAERQHHVGLGDKLHRGLRAVVAERPDGERDGCRGSCHCAGSCCRPAHRAFRPARRIRGSRCRARRPRPTG